MLKAGISSDTISPPEGLELAGYARGDRHNAGIHDDLYASCLYLRQGDVQAVIVSLDILTVQPQVINAVRSAVTAQTDIPAANILLCSTHTHSGPRGYYDDYNAALSSKLVHLILQAKASAFDAEIGVATECCGPESGVGGNRFIRGGTADPTAGVIAVRETGGTVRAVFVNYALHPTILHEDNILVSADYPGAVRRTVTAAFPGALCGFLQGASGNQSTRYFRQGQDYLEVERIGSAIGRAALRAISKISFSAVAPITLRFSRSRLFLREYPPTDLIRREIAEKNALEQKLINENAPYADIQDAHNKAIGAECLLENALKATEVRDSMTPETDHCKLAGLRIGDDLILFSQGEIFVEFALRSKAASHAVHTLFVTLANGYLPGYVYTRESMSVGGYEIDSSMLAPETGEALGEAAEELAVKMTG